MYTHLAVLGTSYSREVNYSSRSKSVRSTSASSKRCGNHSGGRGSRQGIMYCARYNITSQRQDIVLRCLSSYVGNVFGLHSKRICFPCTRKLATQPKCTFWSRLLYIVKQCLFLHKQLQRLCNQHSLNWSEVAEFSPYHVQTPSVIKNIVLCSLHSVRHLFFVTSLFQLHERRIKKWYEWWLQRDVDGNCGGIFHAIILVDLPRTYWGKPQTCQ
jgi:hypothetical protein